MAREVWKFEVTEAMGKPLEIEVPQGATFLHFDIAQGVVCVWMEVDPDVTYKSKRVFRIYGTGRLIEPRLTYRGTVVTPYQYVWHLYEDVFV